MTLPAPRPTPPAVPVIEAKDRARRPPSPKVFGPLLPRLRPHTRALSLAAICLVLSAAVGLAFPRIVQYLLDAAFISGNARGLDRIAVGLLVLFAIQGVLNAAQVYLLSATGERVVATLRQDLFAHLVRLSPGFFTERRTGELISRLSADVAMLQSVMSHQVSEFARQSLFLVGGIAMLMLTHTRLTATTLAVVPIVVGAAWVFGRQLRKASTGVQDRVAEATASAEEAFSQIRTVQGFTREGLESDRYHAHLVDVVTAAIRRARIRGAFFGVITFFSFGGIVAVLWQGGRLVLGGALTRVPCVLLSLCDHRGRSGWRARVAVRQLPGTPSARRSGCSSAWRAANGGGAGASEKVAASDLAARGRARGAGKLSLPHRRTPSHCRVSFESRRARRWHASGRRARARRRSPRCCRASGM